MINYKLRQALNTIEKVYGKDCNIKPTSLLKFGRNALVGTDYATLAEMPATIENETFVSSNLIINISSSDASDTEEIGVVGHKLVGSELIEVTQFITLNGQNKVLLDTPLMRCNRLFANGSNDIVGNVCTYEDDTITNGVPDTPTKVHCMLMEGNTSFKASTSISSNEFYIITQMMASINKKTSATIDAEIQSRAFGKVFRTGPIVSLSSTGVNTIAVSVDPAIIIPSNYDVRLRAKASTTNVSVSGWMNGYLAKVKK